MTPIQKSFLLYLVMLILLAINIEIVNYFQLSTFLIYIIIILAVFYINEGIYWGEKIIPGLLLGVVLIGVIFLLEIMAGWIKVQEINFNSEILFLFFILHALVATGEEISFRGYILKNLMENIGIQKGIFLSSFMFSAIHLPSMFYYNLDISRGVTAFVVIGLIGSIAAIIYIKFGLKSAIGFHFSWNFFQYNIFTLAETQKGIMEISNFEPNLITGGNFGPEAGIVGFSVVLLALVILARKYSQNLS